MKEMEPDTLVQYVCHTDDKGRVVKLRGSEVDYEPVAVSLLVDTLRRWNFAKGMPVVRIVVECDGLYLVLTGERVASRRVAYIEAPTEDAAILTAEMV